MKNSFGANVKDGHLEIQGKFSIFFEDKLKELILSEYKKDKKLNHGAIFNPTVHDLHLSKRESEEFSMLVGYVCIGDGNYIKYIVNRLNILALFDLQLKKED